MKKSLIIMSGLVSSVILAVSCSKIDDSRVEKSAADADASVSAYADLLKLTVSALEKVQEAANARIAVLEADGEELSGILPSLKEQVEALGKSINDISAPDNGIDSLVKCLNNAGGKIDSLSRLIDGVPGLEEVSEAAEAARSELDSALQAIRKRVEEFEGMVQSIELLPEYEGRPVIMAKFRYLYDPLNAMTDETYTDETADIIRAKDCPVFSDMVMRFRVKPYEALQAIIDNHDSLVLSYKTVKLLTRAGSITGTLPFRCRAVSMQPNDEMVKKDLLEITVSDSVLNADTMRNNLLAEAVAVQLHYKAGKSDFCTDYLDVTPLNDSDSIFIKDFTPEELDAELEIEMDNCYREVTRFIASLDEGGRYSPYRVCRNLCGDDVYAIDCGGVTGLQALNQFSYDDRNEAITRYYQNLYSAINCCNTILTIPGNLQYQFYETATAKRILAEAKVLRAWLHLTLAESWGTPPIAYQVSDQYNLPPNASAKEEILSFCLGDCNEAINDLSERDCTWDKEGAYRVTKGFANALMGKIHLYLGNYNDAAKSLEAVINSGQYSLSGDYANLFHWEGNGNEEKIFELNVEGYMRRYSADESLQRNLGMERRLWAWPSDGFVTDPAEVYSGIRGWGGIGVPQAFGNEFLDNDSDCSNPRLSASLIKIDNAVYGEHYINGMYYAADSLNNMGIDQKKASASLGIGPDGLPGQSFWLPLKWLPRKTDFFPGTNIRRNNFTVMRYAEVLLMYAEARAMGASGNINPLFHLNQIRQRSNIAAYSSLTLEAVQKEKKFELWLEGCRWFDILRWNNQYAQDAREALQKAGKKVPTLYDKLSRQPLESEAVIWQYDKPEESRFYMVLRDAPGDCGFKAGKHELFPFPHAITSYNPYIQQNQGWN